jgi:hypothetical protein
MPDCSALSLPSLVGVEPTTTRGHSQGVLRDSPIGEHSEGHEPFRAGDSRRDEAVKVVEELGKGGWPQDGELERKDQHKPSLRLVSAN